MSKKKCFVCFLLSIILGYFICVFIPCKIFIPNIDYGKQYSTGEYYYYIISTIQAIGTVGAVIVALFMDTIKSFFRKPKLEIRLHHEDLQEELNNSTDVDKKAKRYHHSIDIHNFGNINAENCEIHMENIQFTGLGMQKPTEIMQNEVILKWHGTIQSETTYIPVQGKKSFQLFEVFPPEELSTKGGRSQQKPPYIIIGDFQVPNEYCGGKWNVLFCLYSPNIKPLKFNVIIDWDGKWENRQMEMKNKIKTTIQNYK